MSARSAPAWDRGPVSAATRPLRVGMYNSTLPHPARKPGGTDIYVDRLAQHLSGRGHDVVLFTYSPPLPGRTYAHCRLEPDSIIKSRASRLLLAPLRLNALDSSRLDVLHLHGDDWFYLRRRVPTVRTFYGSALYEARHATANKRRAAQYAVYTLEMLASRLATASYGIGPRVGPGYRTAGHLPLSVDAPSDYTFARSGPPTVLFVGTWAGRKRGWLIHEQFVRETLPRVPDARLVMVSDRCGAGPGVEWVPRPSDEELSALYRSAWVMCMPSSYEGFGLPYVEAMAVGTPVVTTINPGAAFVLAGGRYGAVVSENDLGSRIAALLADEQARLALARTGRDRVEGFSWDVALDLHERAYREAIERFRPEPSPAPRATLRPLGPRRPRR